MSNEPKTGISMILSRKEALYVGWRLFWFATGSSKVGVIVEPDRLEIIGANLMGYGEDRA